MSMEVSTVVRRTKFAAEETRKQILDAAELCFCETGISKTTLEMIAARAGCTRGAIYWHFNEKNDLLRQVIERVPLSLFDELESIKDGRVPEPVKAMHRCLSRSLIKLQYDVHLRNVIYIVFFCKECPDDIRIDYLQGMVDANKFIELLVYIFETAKSHREICTDLRSETLAYLFFSLFTGMVRSCILLPENEVFFRESSMVLELLLTTLIGVDKEAHYNEK
ncbi:TetR family transcriptional regulator [Citrobacter koseri]|uniref:TetR family transcriptional regulator n=1 Tax=Citrobacter koseri TaxID=545 RepID=UPI00294325EE|nr:TetR family transcriptional regulator [Citrobacter koseri]MEB2704040.1 TetR family transcriptional regulator [Citrobacter koseri]MEB2709579.1 TetR family transcriptional regulator [Citrobacter koseri]WOJ30417.1 TetR family transcriptional regulator [Citrobacter koseri]WOJ34591.1 TetR family transcriptional regulator [Citrobacter koseri]